MPTLLNPFRRERKGERETGEDGDSPQNQTFIKAMSLRGLEDLEAVKREVNAGNIVILKVTPLASRSVEEVERAVNDLCAFVASIDGDIARLGEERIVVCPPHVRIWRGKAAVASESPSTAV